MIDRFRGVFGIMSRGAIGNLGAVVGGCWCRPPVREEADTIVDVSPMTTAPQQYRLPITDKPMDVKGSLGGAVPLELRAISGGWRRWETPMDQP